MLNWEAIGATGELIAAVAVVGSLLFVGSQLRQARFVERANAQRDLLRQASDWVSSTSSDSELFKAVRECLQEFNGAAPIVRDRFNSWAFTFPFITESAYYKRENDFSHDNSFKGIEQVLLSIIATRGGKQWWALAYQIVGADVGNHIKKRLEETDGSIPP